MDLLTSHFGEGLGTVCGDNIHVCTYVHIIHVYNTSKRKHSGRAKSRTHTVVSCNVCVFNKKIRGKSHKHHLVQEE